MKIPTMTLAALLAAGAACAAPPRPQSGGPDAADMPPPAAARVPADETLATIYGLTVAQQQQIRTILRERRDAERALHERMRSERDALARKDEAEHDRISDHTTQELRSALGDKGYLAWARWQSMQGPHPAHPFGPPGRDGAGGPPGMPPAAGEKHASDADAGARPH
jgi:hypothetical protein